jgi:hypothetical protein
MDPHLYFNKPLKELTPTFFILLQEIKRKKTLLNSVCEASITLIPKPNKEVREKRIIDQYI